MKVPGDKKSLGVYPDKKDYFNTICRLWIGLTFEDGNKALSPKCRDRAPGATRECGTVNFIFCRFFILLSIYIHSENFDKGSKILCLMIIDELLSKRNRI